MRKVIAKYTNNQLDGRYEVYDSNNNLIERGKYINGRKSLFWRKYYKNGNTKSIRFYDNGKLDGVYCLYDRNGKLIIRGRFSQGVKVGEWELYRFLNKSED